MATPHSCDKMRTVTDSNNTVDSVGICAACGNAAALVNGHVISRLFVSRMQLDAGTRYLRGMDANLRFQDGKTLRMFCKPCEDLISDSESAFARSLYHRIRDGDLAEVEWTESLHRFMSSVTLRNILLAETKKDGPTDDRTEDDWEAIAHAKPFLAEHVLGGLLPNEYEHYVFVFGITRDGPTGINSALHHVCANVLPTDDEVAYSVVIVPGMLLVTILRSSDERRSLWNRSTRVTPGSIFRSFGQHLDDGRIGALLIRFAEEFERARQRVSPAQQALLAGAARGAPWQRIASTTLGKAWAADAARRQRDSRG